MWSWLIAVVVGMPLLAGVLAAASFGEYCPLYGYESRGQYALRWGAYRWMILLAQSFWYSLLDVWDCLRGQEGFGWTVVSIIGNFIESPWHINHNARINHQRRQNEQASA